MSPDTHTWCLHQKMKKGGKAKSQQNKLNKKNDFLYLLIKNKIKNGLLPLTPAFHRDCKMLHERKSENVVEVGEFLIQKNFLKSGPLALTPALARKFSLWQCAK